MTSTRSKVQRKTERAYSVLYCSGRKRRPIVVSIMPGDVLEFRELGRRGKFAMPIDTAFKYAVQLNAFMAAAEKYRATGKTKKRKVARR